MRRNFRDRRQIDAGPTVLTMRWVFDELFAAAGTSLSEHLDLRPARYPRAPCLERPGSARPVRRHRPVSDAIGHFAGPAEARGLSGLLRPGRIDLPALEHPFLRASQPTPVSLVRHAGMGGLGGLWGIAPFSSLWRRTWPLLQGRQAAAAVRPLRHLLRLLAVPGAGDPDAGRACRAGRRLAHRGRHASARRGARRPGAGARARRCAMRRRKRGPRRHRAGRAASGWPSGERIAKPTPLS